jgi:hypothetical protein
MITGTSLLKAVGKKVSTLNRYRKITLFFNISYGRHLDVEARQSEILEGSTISW